MDTRRKLFALASILSGTAAVGVMTATCVTDSASEAVTNPPSATAESNPAPLLEFSVDASPNEVLIARHN